jgi:hypothetical protein
MDLTLQESKTHARVSEEARARVRKRTENERERIGTKPDGAVQTEPRTGAQTKSNDPRTKRATRRQRPGPVIRQPNQGGREPRGKTTANNPLTAPMLPGMKTSTRQTRRGKTGTGAPQAQNPAAAKASTNN